jgi:transcriptional regulator with GAF, ATPase, and Fis domain
MSREVETTTMYRDETFEQARPVAWSLPGTAGQAFEDDLEARAECEQAIEAMERALALDARVRTLVADIDPLTGRPYMVSDSDEWHDVLTQAARVAPTATTVLLLGESGTGKEVVARFVHRASSRDRGPFVAINCAALPEQLLEAELFGYERGAFTGAVQSKPGRLEQAAGGTLFLDEIGELPPSSQAKLLRVLQEREFQRVGGTRVLRTDARIVAATNRHLRREVANGQFREDLYYRLNVFPISLPALRDRRRDILPLSESFVAAICRSMGTAATGISTDAQRQLLDYHWPGNARELRNTLERAVILCDGSTITPEHLAFMPSASLAPPPVQTPARPLAESNGNVGSLPANARDLASLERTMIEEALVGARFNKSKAAKAIGLTRHQLYVRMRKYGIA